MAGTKGAVTTSSIATGTAVKTILTLTAPALVALVVKRLSISFNGISPTGPKVRVQVRRTVAGGTGTSITPVNINASDAEVPQATAKENYTAEPGTPGTVIFDEFVHPQGGYTAPEEIKIKKNETLSITVEVATSVNCVARANFEE